MTFTQLFAAAGLAVSCVFPVAHAESVSPPGEAHAGASASADLRPFRLGFMELDHALDWQKPLATIDPEDMSSIPAYLSARTMLSG